ncbi:urease accessory protein D-like [Coffea eugenioides]|uniref:urease accessory protein D-like n=1 Tax=Coffea eugenioides TaxID=49369 RepID=UPI000F614D00|nr:urease accessory protein D-like [Coffea eugenioides]
MPLKSMQRSKVEEALALRAAMVRARIEGWRNVEFETDCKVVVDKLGEETAEDAQICRIIKDSIKQLSLAFDKCCFSFTKRETVWKTEAAKADIEEQLLKARIGSDALLAVIPDPVTCFSTAKYSQTQVFKVFPSSSLLIVDWITSGRYERGEKWDFELYKSTKNIFLEADEPLLLDTILLEQGRYSSIAERMVILLGPKLKFIQDQIQENVKSLMSQQFLFLN